jgi:protein-disulfide isomerase
LNDVQQGDKVGIQAVPTFFIKGQQIPLKLSIEDFSQVIDAQLRK